jgi:hypothetical protein
LRRPTPEFFNKIGDELPYLAWVLNGTNAAHFGHPKSLNLGAPSCLDNRGDEIWLREIK